MPTGYVYEDIFLKHAVSGHPESPERLRAIMDRLEKDGLLNHMIRITAPEALHEDLESVHQKSMIWRIMEAAQDAPVWLDADTYVAQESYPAALKAAGGGMKLVSEVMEGRVTNGIALVRPPGHHATANQSMGFCLFNNIAVAARHLQKKYDLLKIAIIDWDVHHGNGTQDIFYDDPTVFYMSTHLGHHYPGTGAAGERGKGEATGTTLNFPMNHGVPLDEFMRNFKQGMERIAAFDPDFILISAGFDSHADDPLGGLPLRESDFADLTGQVCDLAEELCHGRTVSFLEGGYNLQTLTASLSAHAKTLIGRG